jgi:NTE family protein
VLRALEQAGIEPDIVVGTSAGAVVGAAYASGLSAGQIEAIGSEVELSSLIDLTLSSSGLMRGDNIARWIDSVASGKPIEKFPRRFGAVATDLRTGQAVLLDRGSPGAAVQASAAVPGVNVPIAYTGGHLVDGGIASLVPVRFARAMGADFVIAADIYCQGPSGEGLAAPSVLMRVMRVQSCLVSAPEAAEADMLIAPQVSVSGLSAKDQQQNAISAGYAATAEALRRFGSRLPVKRNFANAD